MINDDDNLNLLELQEDVSNAHTIDVARYIKKIHNLASREEINSFTTCSCKHDLFLLKCLIEDLYKDLPTFPNQEAEWEKNRVFELLKKGD